MSRQKIYDGIDKDPTGAMNPTGNIIRDAWVFGLLPETEIDLVFHSPPACGFDAGRDFSKMEIPTAAGCFSL